jgi:hypothetical protein
MEFSFAHEHYAYRVYSIRPGLTWVNECAPRWAMKKVILHGSSPLTEASSLVGHHRRGSFFVRPLLRTKKNAPRRGVSKVPTQGDKIEPVKLIQQARVTLFRRNQVSQKGLYRTSKPRPSGTTLAAIRSPRQRGPGARQEC